MSAHVSPCAHTSVRELGWHGFSGPVSRNENPAAHGCISLDEECCACGARRARLVNGRHEEIGDWVPVAPEVQS